MSPSSTTRPTAVMNDTPRSACSAATTGAQRHAGASCRSCSVSRSSALRFFDRVSIFLQRDVLVARGKLRSVNHRRYARVHPLASRIA